MAVPVSSAAATTATATCVPATATAAAAGVATTQGATVAPSAPSTRWERTPDCAVNSGETTPTTPSPSAPTRVRLPAAAARARRAVGCISGATTGAGSPWVGVARCPVATNSASS